MANEHNDKKMKNYVYNVYCSFQIQNTFTEDEVERDYDGDETDREPTLAALEAFSEELNQYMSQLYVVSNVDADANSLNMIDSFTEEDDSAK